MKNFSLFLLLLLCFSPLFCFASKNYIDLYHYDFSIIDHEVRGKRNLKCDNVYDVSRLIVSKYEHPHERVRAAWIWITDNIAYDVDIYNIPMYEAVTSPNEVMKTRKTICCGYSKLLKAILDVTDPNLCIETDGLAKTDLMVTDAHSWNLINLYGFSYLLDPTWGAGFVQDKEVSISTRDHKIVKEFVKNYNEFWFLTPPSYFAVSHYNENPWHQLLVTPISKALFLETPYVYADYFEEEIANTTKNATYDPVIIHDNIKVISPINLKAEWLFFHNFFTQGSQLKPKYLQTARLHFYSQNKYEKIKVNKEWVTPIIKKRKMGYDYYIPYTFQRDEIVTLQDYWKYNVEISN